MKPEMKQQIDKIFALWDSTHTPGCALGILKDGEMIYRRNYGMANLEYGIPIQDRTVFQIGSVSKQFAAMAILLLVEEGKISLADNIRSYVPEVPDFGETITIRNLVHHTSGLRDILEIMIMSGTRLDDVMLKDDYLDLVQKQTELNFSPGERHLYCNQGYLLLAEIVERVSGQTIREFCQERLFGPLGMSKTLFHDNYKEVIPNLASSYTAMGPDTFMIEHLTHGLPGSTSILTTVDDLAKWDEMFYTGEVVGKDVIRKMKDTAPLNNGDENNYAFGLSLGEYRGFKVEEHGGVDAGFRAHLYRIPEQHFSVIITGNVSSINSSVLSKQVADIMLEDVFELEKPVEVSLPEKPYPVDEETIKKLEGAYYSPETEAIWKLKIKDGKLTVDLGPGFDLIPVSENRFALSVLPQMQMTFKTNEDTGNPCFEITGQKGTLYDWYPIPDLSVEELKAYAGKYFSPEMDVTYEVVYKDKALFMALKKMPSMPLKPAKKDSFMLDLSEIFHQPYSLNISFETASGKVTGFRLSSGRALRVLFKKN